MADSRASSRLRSERGTHFGEAHHQGHGFERRWVESQGRIEGFRFLGNGVHEDAANADRVGRIDDAHGGIPKQDAAEATTLMGAVDCEAGQDHDGDRSGHIAPEAPRGGGNGDGTRGERVETDDPIIGTNHEGAGGAARLSGGLTSTAAWRAWC